MNKSRTQSGRSCAAAFLAWRARQRGRKQESSTKRRLRLRPTAWPPGNYDFSAEDEACSDEIQHGCFQYFWKEVGEPAKLAKDKTSDTICSIAAVGFQLSSLPIGVERGWITREEGEQRAVTVLQFARQPAQTTRSSASICISSTSGTEACPISRDTKYRYELVASTVDHALLAGRRDDGRILFRRRCREACRPASSTMPIGAAMYDEKAGYLHMGWRAETDRGVDGPGEFTAHTGNGAATKSG